MTSARRKGAARAKASSHGEVAAAWRVEFHDEFDREFDDLGPDVQDELLAAATAIERLGPAAERPYVGKLANSRHSQMKELRFKANRGNEIWRAAFAFDPERRAVILVAADKQGQDEKRFYRRLVAIADRRFDGHLERLAKRAKIK